LDLGIELGDLPMFLLSRNELEQLNILTLKPSVGVAALIYFDQKAKFCTTALSFQCSRLTLL